MSSATKGGFRTDSAISNNRFGAERTLTPWVPDSTADVDGGLESSNNHGHWDQFAENERRFGIRTDYDENIYTTAIDKNHPQYRERMAAAERKAREIERSIPTTAHVAEERVMDHAAGDSRGDDEEEKYSGVRRQDFPPLSNRDEKYTPPAKRAPSAQTTVTGAPVDPAIISSQVRAPAKKQPPVKAEETKTPVPASKLDAPQATERSQTAEAKLSKPVAPNNETNKPSVSRPAEGKSTSTNTNTLGGKLPDKTMPSRPLASSSHVLSSQPREGIPSAALTVERDVLNSFKSFASQQRQTADKLRSNKAKADKEVKLTELKKFAEGFKLSTPVPTDLISIITKDPTKQKEIQAKAIQNAEDVARTKAAEAAAKPKDPSSKDNPVKPATTAVSPVTQVAPDTRSVTRTTGSQFANSPGPSNRHANARQSYATSSHHNGPYRNDRPGQHLAQQGRQPLGQRLRNVEQQKLSQPPPHAQPPHPQQHAGAPEMRVPPTGPANSSADLQFGRRLSGVPGHMGAKLNPNSHEFRPNPYASSFNPNGAQLSAASSPRSAAGNNNATDPPTHLVGTGQLIRRKTKAIDVKKCFILANIKTYQPPQGRNWEDNGSLKPSYDTLPTWRQIHEEDETQDSTMRLTYKEFLEQQSFATPSAAPNPPHVGSSAPHHYQLPLHLQGPHGTAPRQSPNLPSMPMHTQPGHAPHATYNNVDDHRMMHSNSAQSFASPRMAQVPITYGPPVSSPAPVPYNQPIMQPYMSPGTPQMGQFRSFSNSHQPYLPQQPGHVAGGPMMMQPQFINPQGLVQSPQLPMYGAHAQFVPPNAGPSQTMPASNGYPSPGRPSAPMMSHQGSQQGQSVYGMSPNLQYQQPVFVPQQPGGQGASSFKGI
ncbi:hypothetical protein SODALDRAFT_37602 [Sodiomyces alkalinus F11]|uniref:LsmAD domain-containing protein n=1 Tax=Sodiomyces alkalinus (strain CBS 110278 / VKM F-3762 / F11) TaxID=1314773 RepID=A0A3N2Q9D2_SODAK|nr:hypothetical protein SODALDRAFT_37602 [Sodiomyces alkalinus F11]ROT43371.1 hypothetical protein SODALDRAFT_37602 [Sodiomyces alkalinus F11]